ncbi:LPFR motif small protein [Streptomyces sp. A5-4]
MLRATGDGFRMAGSAIATVVTSPFRLVAKLFGGASSTASRGGRRA